MKKTISIIILFLLIIVFISGCGTNTSTHSREKCARDCLKYGCDPYD